MILHSRRPVAAVVGSLLFAGCVATAPGLAAAPGRAAPARGSLTATNLGLHEWRLRPTGLVSGAYFGSTVATSGNTLVVGAPFQTVAGQSQEGEVFVYQRPATGWRAMAPTAVLTIPGGVANDNVGYAVAIQGSTIAVGAIGRSSHGTAQTGAVYVYNRPTGGWRTGTPPVAELTEANPVAHDGCGGALGISSTTIVVGCYAHSQDSGTFFEGAAYVFVRPTGGWRNATQTATLEPTGLSSFDEFGEAVAVSGDEIVVGAPGRYSDTGRAYLFRKPSAGWGVNGPSTALNESSVFAGSGNSGAVFGGSVAVSGPTVVVGESDSSNGAPSTTGAAYVFVEPSGGWATVPPAAGVLTVSGPTEQYLGTAVGLLGRTVVAGAPGTPSGYGLIGAFREPSGGWASETQAGTLAPTSPVVGNEFGTALAVAPSYLVGGAYGEQNDSGAVYVFSEPGPTIAALGQTHRTWAAGNHPALINQSRYPSGGTKFTVKLSEPGTVTMVFRQPGHGVVGRLRFGARRLSNVVYVDGPLDRHHRLRPGKASVSVSVTNSFGTSPVKSLHFTVT